MSSRKHARGVARLSALLAFMTGTFAAMPPTMGDTPTWNGQLVQYGSMHDAIGSKHDQGRVMLKSLVERPHFYGVAALEHLAGEATICDSTITLTRVDPAGQLASAACSSDEQATLLVGAYVPAWSEFPVAADVDPDALDDYLADVARRAAINPDKPFVFLVEGKFAAVRLHVINGACPLHARLKKIELPPEDRPFETEFETIPGTIVGVFAKDAVGDITHPATSTHTHLLFKDAVSGKLVTGHVEQVGLLKGAIVRVPQASH